MLDEDVVLAVFRRGDESLHESCREQLERLRQAETDNQPKIIPVPSDDELATLDDPIGELQTHLLRHLRGRAEQRDTTCVGLLISRFTPRFQARKHLRAKHDDGPWKWLLAL